MTFLQTDLIRASANLKFNIGGHDLINVMYFELLSPSSLGDSLVLADIGQMFEVYYTILVSTLNLNVQFIDYTVKNETADAAPLTATWPTLTTGSNVNDVLPNQNVPLVIMRTAKSRKSGRVNLGGFSEAAQAGSLWTAPVTTTVGLFITQLLTTQIMTNGNYRYGVASQAVTPPRTIANSFDAPLSGKLIAGVRTQRRRTIGFGS